MGWRQNPGDLFRSVRAANPEKPAIVSMRELTKAIAEQRMPKGVSSVAGDHTKDPNGAEDGHPDGLFRPERPFMLGTSPTTWRPAGRFTGSATSVHGPGNRIPASRWTSILPFLGVAPVATAQVRDHMNQTLLLELAGEDSGLTSRTSTSSAPLKAMRWRPESSETVEGINWAKRNMKRVIITNPDGTPMYRNPDGSPRAIVLGAGDPVGEMAQAEHMAKFRQLAMQNGDYNQLFDSRGFLNSKIFDDPNNAAARDLWNKYMEMLSDSGIDYYRTKTQTAAGGCLDMAKHLNEEVLTKKFKPQAKLKKTLKYVSRANNISRGAPGLVKLMASDPLLGDPAYQDVVSLAKQISGASDAQVDAILKERFGDTPDAGLQELGNKARRVILRMAELSSGGDGPHRSGDPRPGPTPGCIGQARKGF